jgi:hypothetical protein
MPTQTGTFSGVLQICLDCLVTCEQCADACLDEPGLGSCARLARDTADVASTALLLVSRDSSLAPQALGLLAAACDRCASECARHDHNVCKLCCRACDQCVELF